jgi:hypothetical protein
VRIRLTAAFGIAAALLGLTACRNSPEVAAYVGDTAITEARVTRLQEGYNKVAPADRQVGRAIVVQYLVHEQLCERLSKAKGFGYTTPSLPTEAPELAVVATRTDACIQAIPAPEIKPSDAEYRALFDRAIAAGLIAPGTSFDVVRQQWQGDADLNELLARERQLAGAADVTINPRYGQLSVLGLNPAVAAPLGDASDVVVDRPPTAAPR